MEPYNNIVYIFAQDNENSLKSAIDALRKLQTKIEGENYEHEKDISVFLKNMDKKPGHISQLQWDKYRFIAYLSCSQIVSHNFMLQLNNVETAWGPLINILSTICTFKSNRENYWAAFYGKLIDYLHQLSRRSERVPFYPRERSEAAEFIHIPKMFYRELPNTEIMSTFQKFNPKCLSEVDVHILYEIILSMAIDIGDNFPLYTRIFDSDLSPSYLLDKMLKIWIKPVRFTTEITESVKKVIFTLQKVTMSRYYEFSPQYNWNAIIYIYKQVDDPLLLGMTISFFAFVIKKIIKFISSEVCKQHAHTLSQNYVNKRDRSYYTYFMYSMISAVSMISEQLLEISFPTLALPDSISTNQLYKDQTNESYGILMDTDKILYTKLNIKMVNSQKELRKQLENSIKEFNRRIKRLHNPLYTIIYNITIIYKILIESNRDGEQAAHAPLFYAVNIAIEEIMRVICIISKKIVEQKFSLSQLIDKHDIHQIELHSIKKVISSLFNNTPTQFERYVALHLSDSLYRLLENGETSAVFCKYFNEIVNPSTGFYKVIIDKMMSKALSVVPKFLSFDLEGSETASMWIIFIIRLSLTNVKMCHYLGSVLKNFKKPIINQLFPHIREIPNQKAVLTMANIYIKVIKTNVPEQNMINIGRSFFIIEPVIETITKYAPFVAKEIVNIFLDQNPQHIVESPFIQFLKYAFKSNDPILIKKASDAFILIIKAPKSKFAPDSETYKQLLKSWYSARSYMKNEDIVRMGGILAKTKLAFLYTGYQTFKFKGIEYEPTGGSLSDFLKDIFENIKDNLDEAANLYALTRQIFVIIKEEFSNDPKLITKPLNYLVMIMNFISKYKQLSGALLAEFDEMNDFFLIPFCIGYSNIYITTLLTNYGSSNSGFLEMVIERFLSKLADKECPSTVIAKLVNEIFEVDFSISWYSTCFGTINMLHKYFPKAINLKQIFKLLQLANNTIITNNSIIKEFSRFLKRYESNLTPEERVQYVQEIYNMNTRVTPNMTIFMLVIYKRLKKLNIPLQIEDFTKVRTSSSQYTYLFRAAIILACTTTIGPLPPEELSRVRDLLVKLTSHEYQEKSLEKFQENSLFIMIVCNAIFTHNENIDIFFPDFSSRRDIIGFLLRLFVSPQVPLRSSRRFVAKCLRLIIQKFENDHSVMSIILDAANRDEKSTYLFASVDPKRLCKPANIKTFFSRIKSFSELNGKQQLLEFPKIIFSFKALSSEDIFKIHGAEKYVKEISTESNKSLISVYIESIFKIIPSREIPFWAVFGKFVYKFCLLFHREVMDLILSPSLITISASAELAEYLMFNDPTKTFVHDWYDILKTVQNFSIFPIGFIDIMPKMSRVTSFVRDEQFRGTICSIFISLADSYDSVRFINEFATKIITVFGEAYFNVIAESPLPEIPIFVKVSRIFIFHDLKYTGLYNQYKKVFYRKDEQIYNQQLINFILSNIERLKPAVTDVVLSNCVRRLKIDDETAQLICQSVISDFERKEGSHLAIDAHILRLLLENNYNITSKYQQWLRFIPTIYESSNTDLAVETTRSLIEYGKRNRIPDRLFVEITRHFFINNHYFDSPFKKYTLEFLELRMDILEKRPDSIVEAVNIFVADKTPIHSNIGVLINIITELPLFAKYIPLSFLTTLINNIWYQLQRGAIIGVPFIYSVQYASTVDLTDDEFKQFFNIGMLYLKKILSGRDVVYPDSILAEKRDQANYQLLKFFMKKPEEFDFNREEVINIIKEFKHCETDSIRVIAVCIIIFYRLDPLMKMALEEISTIFNKIYEDAINQTTPEDRLEYYAKFLVRGLANTRIYEGECKSILTDVLRKYYPVSALYNIVPTVIEEICNSKEENRYEFFTIILRIICENKGSNSREKIYSKILKLISKVGLLSPEEQIPFIDIIYNQAMKQSEYAKILIASIPDLVNNPKVLPIIKEKLINAIPFLIRYVPIKNYDILVDSILAFSKDISFDPSEAVINILFLKAIKSNSTTIINVATRLLEMFPPTPEERFAILSQKLPLYLWNNKYIALVLLLINGMDETTLPLFGLAKLIQDSCESLSQKVFTKILNANTSNSIKAFLWKVLKLKGVEMQHSHLIKGIIRSYEALNIPLQFDYIKKASNLTNLQFELSQFASSQLEYTPLLLPCEQNGLIFARTAPESSTEEAAGALSFFHGYYDIANGILQNVTEPSNGCIKKIKELCLRMNTSSPDDFLISQRGMDSKAEDALNVIINLGRLINSQVSQGMTNEIKSSIQALEICIAEYMKSHVEMHEWQKEKILSMEYIIYIALGFTENGMIPSIIFNQQFQQKQQLPHNIFMDYIHCRNPYSYSQIEEDEGDGFIILPQQALEIIPRIKGFTTGGEIAASGQAVEDGIIDFTKRQIQNHCKKQTFLTWSSVLFHIFINEPTNITLNSVIKVGISFFNLCDTLPYWNSIAGSTIISALHIALGSEDPTMKQAAYEAMNMVRRIDTLNKGRFLFLIPEILALNNDLILSIFKDMIESNRFSKDIYLWKQDYYTALFMLRRDEFNNSIPEVKKKYPMIDPYLMFLLTLEDFFNNIFNINWAVYSKQRRIASLIIETSVLPDSYVPDIDQIRSTPTNKTVFEKFISKAPEDVINKIRDFEQFKATCKEAFAKGEVDRLVDTIFESEINYVETKEYISGQVERVNRVLNQFPKIHALVSKQSSKNLLPRSFLKEIERVDDNTLLIPTLMLSSMAAGAKNYLVVSRKEGTGNGSETNEAHMVNTLMHFLFVESNSNSESFNVSFPFTNTFQVGPKYSIIFYPTKPIFISKVFEKAIGYPLESWNPTEENIANVPDNYMLEYFTKRMTKQEFYEFRNAFVSSISSSFVIRHFFNAPYPKLSQFSLSMTTGDVYTPSASIVGVHEAGVNSCFRLSPSIQKLIGDNCKERVVYSASAFSKTLSPTLYNIFPMIYLYVHSKGFLNENPDFRVPVNAVIDRFKEFAPPHNIASSGEDFVMWYNKVNELIDASMVIEDKPEDFIPWF